MKKQFAILILILSTSGTWAQEVRFGFTTGTHLLYKIKYNEAYYHPENAYVTYHESQQGRGVINKFSAFNSFLFGSAINASYKRFTLNAEPQYFFQRTILRFDDPISTERVVGKKAFRIPLYGTYKFWKKENSMYFLAGFIFHKEANYDFQNPGGDVYFDGNQYLQNTLNTGDNHFYKLLYNEKAYWSYTFGLGKITKKGINYAVRFHQRLNTKSRGIMADVWNVEFTINYLIISTRDFTKKHFLYFD